MGSLVCAYSGIQASLLELEAVVLPKLRPGVCFRHLRWIGEQRSSSSLVRVRVLGCGGRVALHPSGCSTQPGGCETRSATSTAFAGTFPAQRTTPRGMLFPHYF